LVGDIVGADVGDLVGQDLCAAFLKQQKGNPPGTPGTGIGAGSGARRTEVGAVGGGIKGLSLIPGTGIGAGSGARRTEVGAVKGGIKGLSLIIAMFGLGSEIGARGVGGRNIGVYGAGRIGGLS
jgi:hypothetical protein